MAVEVGSGYISVFPSVRGFAQKLRRAVADELAGGRGASADVPVTADVSGLRAQLETQVRQAARQVEAEVSTEPAGRGEYTAKLRALVAETGRRVTQQVQVEPRVDRNRFRTALMQGISGAVGQVSSAASTLTGVASNALSSLTGLATALVAVGAASAFTVSGTYLAGGAIGSLPAIAAGAAAALGALQIGLMGIADAFEDAGGAGGGAGVNVAAQARQIAQATRGVESAQRSLARAQREVVAAQEAVTRARKAEAERLQDLNRSVSRARLDEEEATLQVLQAEEDLQEARKSGDVRETQRADLAYRQALLGLEDAKDATEDLTAEQAKAAKVGVEGSDQVQEALQRQRDAVEGVVAANDQLLSAQEALQAAQEKPAGGGGAAKELLRLAPAAQRFVDTVKELKPAFERLRLNVQQKLFAGLDVSVRRLATAWFPQLNKTLGAYAGTFNGLAKRAASSLSQKSFIDNVAAGAESARKALKRVGDAVTGPLVGAFGRLAKAAGPFVERLGDEVADLVEDFSAWIGKLDKNGGLNDFFERASDILSDVFDMGRDVGSIFGSIVKILFNGGDQTVTNSPWEALKTTLDDLARWFRDPENQQKVRDFIDGIKKFLTEDLPSAIRTAKGAIETVSGWVDRVQGWWQRIQDFRQGVADAFAAIGRSLRSVAAPITWAIGEFGRLRDGAISRGRALTDWVGGLPGRIRSALGDTGRILYNAGRNIIQGLINGLRSMFSSLQGTLNWVTNQIPNWKGPADRDRRLLESAGTAIMGGLIRGIGGQVPALRSQLGSVTDVIAEAPLAGGGGPYGASAAPAPAVPVLAFGGDAPDSFIRWLKENVRIYYGGDPVAAIGS